MQYTTTKTAPTRAFSSLISGDWRISCKVECLYEGPCLFCPTVFYTAIHKNCLLEVCVCEGLCCVCVFMLKKRWGRKERGEALCLNTVQYCTVVYFLIYSIISSKKNWTCIQNDPAPFLREQYFTKLSIYFRLLTTI